MICFNCKYNCKDNCKDIKNYSFKWIDNEKNENILNLDLCGNCGTNARITYDVFGIPNKTNEEEVIKFINFNNEIEEIWAKYHYESWFDSHK